MERSEFIELTDNNLPDDAVLFKKPEHGYIGRARLKDSSFLFVIDSVANSNSFVDSLRRINQRRSPYTVFDVICVLDSHFYGYTPLLDAQNINDHTDIYVQPMRVRTDLIRSCSCVSSFGIDKDE